MRRVGRGNYDTREIIIETDVNVHAEGSCLIQCGNTKVLCTASYVDEVPAFLKGKNKGWITAEYSMLPRATHRRNKREIAQGKPNSRTQEIQRLISRSLRAVVDMDAFSGFQIIVDCDVLQADGGTRTASITGGYVAMYMAFQNLIKRRLLHKMPITDHLAAISCGIVNGAIMIDLDYNEDSSAEIDANFVMTGSGQLIEVQATAENGLFSKEQLMNMLDKAENAISNIALLQSSILKN